MTASRALLLKEKETFATSMKDKMNLMELDIKSKAEEIKKCIEELNKQEKFNKQLLMERDKMK